MAIVSYSADGVFTEGLPGTHVDAGDPFSIEWDFNTAAPDNTPSLDFVGTYPDALVSMRLLIDGVEIDEYTTSFITVGNGNSDSSDSLTFGVGIDDPDAPSLTGLTFSAVSTDDPLVDDSLGGALAHLPHYQTYEVALSDGTSAHGQVNNVAVVPAPGSAETAVILGGVMAATMFGRRMRNTLGNAADALRRNRAEPQPVEVAPSTLTSDM